MTEHQSLRILQYNVQKSRDVVLASLFQNSNIGSYNVLAIQEPWRNPFINTSYHPLKDTFHLAYSDDVTTRVCFYINQQLDPKTWTISHSTKDLMALTIHNTNLGTRLHVLNVYNKVGINTLSDLRDIVNTIDRQDEIFVTGDFNLHHPLWTINQRLAASGRTAAQPLITLMQDFHLSLLTTPGMPTHRWREGNSTIDLTFASENLTSHTMYYKIEGDLDCDSDHLPVVSSVICDWQPAAPTRKRQWAKMDIPMLQRTLKERLPRVPADTTLDSSQSIDAYVGLIVEALRVSVEASTPWSNLSPRSVPGFDQECKEVCREVQRLWRRW